MQIGKATRTVGAAFLVLLLYLGVSGAAQPPSMETGVVTRDAASVEKADWGSLLTYFAGESYATVDALTAIAVIRPGMEIHPPHVHSEEEILMVLKGSGTWSVEGREFEAKAGDILYAAPWDEHGISNTGSEPLEFVVFKWNPKPVEPMSRPSS